MIGGYIEKYNGNGKPKIDSLRIFKKAFKLKDLDLSNNEIVIIDNLTHLKELQILNLGFNKIKEIPAGCFAGLKLTKLRLVYN